MKLPKMQVEQTFLILGTLFGLLFIFVTPPFQTPDEYSHFFRAYQISMGKMTSVKVLKEVSTTDEKFFPGHEMESSEYTAGDYLPRSVVETVSGVSQNIPGNEHEKQDTSKILSFLFLKTNPSDKVFVSFPSTSIYSPIPYFPQSLGIFISRIFEGSPLVSMYVGRLFSLLSYLTLIYFAIKKAPSYKNIFLLVGLMPMALFQGISLAPDSLLISGSFLFISLTLLLKKDPGAWNREIFYTLLFLAISLGSAKSAYCLIPLIFAVYVFVKSYQEGESRFRRIAAYFSILALSLASALVWVKFSERVYIPVKVGVDPFTQACYILSNPVDYSRIVVNTIIGYRVYLIEQFVGRLGWLDVALPKVLIYAYSILIFVFGIFNFSDEPRVRLNIADRAVFIFTSIIVGIIAISMVYMSWVPVGKGVIDGLVGRYFIPIVPVFLIGFSSIKSISRIKSNYVNYFLFGACTISLVISVGSLLFRYY